MIASSIPRSASYPPFHGLLELYSKKKVKLLFTSEFKKKILSHNQIFDAYLIIFHRNKSLSSYLAFDIFIFVLFFYFIFVWILSFLLTTVTSVENRTQCSKIIHQTFFFLLNTGKILIFLICFNSFPPICRRVWWSLLILYS